MMTVHVGWLIGVASVMTILLIGSLAYIWILRQRWFGLLEENSEMQREISHLEREIDHRADRERRSQKSLEEQRRKQHEKEMRELQEQHKKELREGRAKSKKILQETSAKKSAKASDGASASKSAAAACEAPPAPVPPQRTEPDQVPKQEYERVLRESERRIQSKQAEIERLTEANRDLTARLEIRENPQDSRIEEEVRRIAELQTELEKRTERAAELFRQNKQMRVGMDGLAEELREARGADSPAYLSEKIEHAISVLDSYVEGSYREGRDA